MSDTNYNACVIYQANQEDYIAAAALSLTIPGRIKYLSYNDETYNELKSDITQITALTATYLVGDTQLSKVVGELKRFAAPIHIFTHRANEKVKSAAVAIHASSTLTTGKHLPSLVFTHLTSTITADHPTRALVAAHAALPKDNWQNTPLSRGIDERLNDIDEYELDAQMQMFTSLTVEDLIKLGVAEIVHDKYASMWESFGYSARRSDSSDSSDSSDRDEPPPLPAVKSKKPLPPRTQSRG